MHILGTGLTGLVGSRIQEVLHPQFTFTSLSRTTGVDITELSSIEPHIADFSEEYVLHMAAYADVDLCEKDRDLGEAGEAWKVNVLGTQNIAHLCKKYNKTLIYISTDFVFDGEKKEGEGYIETDETHPINWYGETKLKGEERIVESGVKHIILRIAYPYGISSAPKKDFVRIIAKRLKENLPLKVITDHIFVPTYIDDIAHAIQKVIETKQEGLFHVAGQTPLSPYSAAVEIAKQVSVDPEVIGKITRGEYFAGKALRPFNLYLKNDKIVHLGIHMRSFPEGVEAMKEFL